MKKGRPMSNRCPTLVGFKCFLLLLCLTVAGLAGFSETPANAAQAGAPPKFEVPGNENVSNVLPPAFISGMHFRVRNPVVSYGYMHTFIVDSDFGVFEARGDFALRKLVREIEALAALYQIKKSDAYLQGLKNAAGQPLEFGMNLISDPVDTISGIPRGVSRLFENVKTGLSSKAETGEDSKAAQALAMSSNKRELASRLGVDVYSSNTVLQKEMNGVAWATAIGSLTLTAALAPVGGAAVAAVSATRMSQQLTDLLREYPPQRLRQINQDKLQAMGIPGDVSARFLDHPSFTPTHKTVIVQSLESLFGAKGRDSYLQYALSADDEESANYMMNIAETMRGYGTKVSAIREISVYGPLVFAKAANGVVMIPVPIDHGMWTQQAGDRVPTAIGAFKAANRDSRKFEMWVTGTMSKLAKDGLARADIKVVEKVGGQIPYLY